MFARKYMDAAEQTAASVTGRLDSVRKAAELIAGTVTGGKRVFVTDRLGIVESELVDKPGNLALFRPLSRSGEQLTQGDMLVITAVTPDDGKDMEAVDNARSIGACVIVIGPEGALTAKADLPVTTGDAGMDAVFPAQGVDRPFGPISGIANMLVFNMIQAETAARIIASGKKPTVLPAEYLPDGKEKRIEALRVFGERHY